MKSVIVKWTAIAVAMGAVIFGCSSVIQVDGQSGQTTTTSSSGDVFVQVDSEFSDAPVSPGGLGVSGNNAAAAEEEGGEATRSFFTAFQIDPLSEDTAGPKFVVPADIDQDGLVDLVTGWNQSQPIQLHLQRRDEEDNVSFRTINLGGTSPIAIIAGVEVGQINDDGWLDVVVLSKATGAVTLCPTTPPSVVSSLEGEIIVLFSPGSAEQVVDGDAWTQMILVNPFVRCRRGTTGDQWTHNQFPGLESEDIVDIKAHPELNGFSSLAVGNVDGVAGDDIVVALNVGTCKELGQEPPINTVDLWLNPGPGMAEIPNQWGTPFFAPDPAVDGSCSGIHEPHPPGDAGIPYSDFLNVPVTLEQEAPEIRHIELLDVDNDGDLDVIAAVSNALSRNVRWFRNPLVPHTATSAGGLAAVQAGASDGWRYTATEWQARPIGQIDTGADAMTLGDVDGDGFTDVIVRSTQGVVQWFRHPNPLVIEPEFPPNDPVPDRFNFPWPVFTLTEFANQAPQGIALGDVTGNGQLELVVAASGAAFWYDSSAGTSVYDPWVPNTIIQDSEEDMDNSASAPGSGVGVTSTDSSTVINALLVIDIDEDGREDIIGTLDRRSGPGLSDDRLVWYRNTRTDDDAVGD